MHQDHGNNEATCMSAIRHGFSSVMMDGSLEADMKTPASYDYNVEITERVSRMAHWSALRSRGNWDVSVLWKPAWPKRKTAAAPTASFPKISC